MLNNLDMHCRSAKKCNKVKFDPVAGYKQMPYKIENISMQGFIWGEEFFAEAKLMFKASNSECKYDIVSETLKVMAISESEIPSELVLGSSEQGTILCCKLVLKLCCHVLVKYKRFPEIKVVLVYFGLVIRL
jgi:hypothetical protein